MIGEYCLLYKTCSICGGFKHHTRFVSNGKDKSRRKRYCHACKYVKKLLSLYSFNTEKLKKTKITVKFEVNPKKTIFYRVSYEDAISMVKEKLACVVIGTLIYQLYSKETFKQLILERDKFSCQYCGGKGNTIDHIIPISIGGISTFSNCVCACEKCNKEKGSLTIEEFLSTQYYQVDRLSIEKKFELKGLENQGTTI